MQKQVLVSRVYTQSGSIKAGFHFTMTSGERQLLIYPIFVSVSGIFDAPGPELQRTFESNHETKAFLPNSSLASYLSS